MYLLEVFRNLSFEIVVFGWEETLCLNNFFFEKSVNLLKAIAKDTKNIRKSCYKVFNVDFDLVFVKWLDI